MDIRMTQKNRQRSRYTAKQTKKSENLQELYGHERGYMKQKRVFGDFWTREGHMWLTHAE